MSMIVIGLNKVCHWCQIIATHGTYTCPTKLIDGELCFRFKKVWYKVAEYASEHMNVFDDSSITKTVKDILK